MRATIRHLARFCDSSARKHWAALADPRLFQIAVLGILLAAGAWLRDLSLRPAQIVLTFASAILTQRATFRLRPNSARSYRSAIITGLSLTILLRADNLWTHPVAAGAAIVSKSALRVRGKHLFNPSARGVIFALVMLPGSWVSPGQWGQDIAIAGWLVALGALVTGRAHRAGTSWSFLAFYAGALALRVGYIGQRWAVLEHQLLNGALLLFAFFMISDPMTSPDHPHARCLHCAIVAAIAFGWQFGLYAQNGLIWALLLAAPLTPLWDALWIAPKYQWADRGGSHETESPMEAAAAGSGSSRARRDLEAA